MLSVHTNYASLIAQNSVTKSNDMLTTAMERLSTGMRINSAADDAAGLQIATRLNANVVGMQTASRNVSDATSMLQTADGGLDELTTIALRQKELATQASNGVNSATDLTALNDEFQELSAEITRILDNTEYAGNNLFDTLSGTVTFQIGADASETLDVTVAEPDTTALGTADLTTGANAAISVIDTFIDEVGSARSELGANINRLGHTASNLSNVTQNTQSAAGRIMDTDFAVESANMTRNQLLVQAGTNILSSANQNTNLVMGLLR
ncbi:Lateral flagellin [Shewanella sp. 202IG2-18]|uniref:flagellin N-terminal helical domain-containing protein n=1 Tax=Parashewanella hymeniacidonis TaxID=2807618 RepID=UPI001961EC7B|nr:flagellin [Parashewanella hymeniacidonis]MBM7071515.1 Lateral flagellin [Parashewanella hymeniacidonis]